MIEVEDVRAAAARLRGVVHRTPVVTSASLDQRVGASVFIKAECYQRTGSFKFRGAYNKISSLDPGERARGVAAFSSGNHAQAVALAARLLGVPAVILMPHDAPDSKVDATAALGADVVRYDRYAEDREALAKGLADDRGCVLVPPYDDPLIMAGQGTAALELLEEVPDLDVLVVPVGGGGLIAGCATAAKAHGAGLRVVGVEPEAGDDTRRSLAAGERVRLDGVPRTIADGQQLEIPGALTFPVVQKRVDEVLSVSDDEIVDTMRFLFEHVKLVAEPSGACAPAALLVDAASFAGQRVGVILSGGNVNADRFAQLLSR